MTQSKRQIEFPSRQGKDESIPYTFDASKWGITVPASPTVTVYLSGTNVTGSTVTGSASVSGSVITLPLIHSLTAGQVYRVELSFTNNGSGLYEAFGFLTGEE